MAQDLKQEKKSKFVRIHRGPTLLAWFLAGKHLWWWIGIAFVVAAGAYFAPVSKFGVEVDLADRVRWVGLAYQLLGLGAVVFGLNQCRKHFKRPALLISAGYWFLELVFGIVGRRLRQDVVIHVGTGRMQMTGHAVRVLQHGGTLEDRIVRLELETRELQEVSAENQREIERTNRRIGHQIEEEQRLREAADKEVRGLLETATIGGIRLELWGLAFLYFGITLTSIPAEVGAFGDWLGL